jgi:anti-sigma factor RsiW
MSTTAELIARLARLQAELADVDKEETEALLQAHEARKQLARTWEATVTQLTRTPLEPLPRRLVLESSVVLQQLKNRIETTEEDA